jgi:AcrR family transcriptional regulator
MPSATSSTRQRLIDVGRDLFYREGFHGVGLDRVLAVTGVTKTTFYNHFESKDALVLEVVQQQDLWWRRTFQQQLRERGGDSPRQQLRAIFDVVNGLIHTEGFRGCMFINVAFEFPSPHDPVHEAAVENKRAIESIVCDLAARAGAKDPVGFAQQITLLMEGVYITSQVTGNIASATIAARVADLMIQSHLAE